MTLIEATFPALPPDRLSKLQQKLMTCLDCGSVSFPGIQALLPTQSRTVIQATLARLEQMSALSIRRVESR
jgi:hypothetical protein